MSEGKRATSAFRILGMDCARCTASISARLRRVDGVSRAAVNYFTEEATVEYDPDKTSPEVVVKAIGKMGYRAFRTDGRLV